MTSRISRHGQEALDSPGSLYARPEDVLKDDGLTFDQKIEVLKNWSDKIQNKRENIQSPMCEDEGSTCEEELQQQIAHAIDALNDNK